MSEPESEVSGRAQVVKEPLHACPVLLRWCSDRLCPCANCGGNVGPTEVDSVLQRSHQWMASRDVGDDGSGPDNDSFFISIAADERIAPSLEYRATIESMYFFW